MVSPNSPVPWPGLRWIPEGSCELFDSIPYNLSSALEAFCEGTSVISFLLPHPGLKALLQAFVTPYLRLHCYILSQLFLILPVGDKEESKNPIPYVLRGLWLPSVICFLDKTKVPLISCFPKLFPFLLLCPHCLWHKSGHAVARWDLSSPSGVP